MGRNASRTAMKVLDLDKPTPAQARADGAKRRQIVDGACRMFLALGIASLRRYLEEKVAAGVLEPHDCEVAAAQFIDSCLSTTFKPMLFNFAGPPPDDRIAHVVGMAVRTFVAAYRAR